MPRSGVDVSASSTDKQKRMSCYQSETNQRASAFFAQMRRRHHVTVLEENVSVFRCPHLRQAPRGKDPPQALPLCQGSRCCVRPAEELPCIESFFVFVADMCMCLSPLESQRAVILGNVVHLFRP